MITRAPWSVSTLDMSGNADSKQMRAPKVRDRPSGKAARSTCAPVPGCTLVGAARHEPGLDVATFHAGRADQSRLLGRRTGRVARVLIDEDLGVGLSSQLLD